MNRCNTTPNRGLGKPQLKRPKLDFSPRSSSPSKITETPGNGPVVRNSSDVKNVEMQKLQCLTTAPDWDDDDDFPSDMLEKVCEIADLSQAMVSREQKEPMESRQGFKRTVSVREELEEGSKLNEKVEKLKLENEKLSDDIKTKEGEVQILRSQLKQHREAKQTETLNNLKLMREMENSYKERLEIVQRDFDAVKTEMQFKELELKSLTERCRQLESSSPKVRLIEPQLSQLDCRKTLGNSKGKNATEESNGEEPISFEFPIREDHEGRKFSLFMCPEYFNCCEEPSVISLYKLRSPCGFHVSSLDFDKREKYIWSDLPKQSVFVKDTYDSVTRLFLRDNFDEKNAKNLIENLLEVAAKILYFQRELLQFLEKLQEKSSEQDDSDCTLLENEEEVSIITLKRLLGSCKIGKEECALESRRALAMIVALTMSSPSVLKMVVDKPGFVPLLRDLVVSVGNLRKPTRYTGILAGITLLLTRLLRENDLEPGLMKILNEITEEIIFARPKLDVLTLVVEALGVANHVTFVQSLCRRGSVESCALYMDSKLHQAMFFTKEACPLKLLCTQIAGLSCIPANQKMRLIATRSFTKWLNRMMDVSFAREIKWMPIPSLSDPGEKCFDVMECFVFLLNACLKDYLSISNSSSLRRNEILSAVGDGCLLFRRILKSDQRLLHEGSHNLRFATLLNHLNCRGEMLTTDLTEVISWVVQLLKNHDCCVKQNQSKSPKGDSNSFQEVINSLKINDDLIIF